MRTLLVAACLLVLAFPVEAHPWFKDWRSWIVIGANQAAAVSVIYAASDCRHKNGIGPCNGGYGEIRARNAVTLVGAAGTSAVGLWGRHMGIKEWMGPALGFTGYNTYEAIHQTKISCPKGEYFQYGTKFTCLAGASW